MTSLLPSPGPWTMHKSRRLGQAYYLMSVPGQGDSNKQIATIATDHINPHNEINNAYLMRAAPEMYQLLRSMVTLAREGHLGDLRKAADDAEKVLRNAQGNRQ